MVVIDSSHKFRANSRNMLLSEWEKKQLVCHKCGKVVTVYEDWQCKGLCVHCFGKKHNVTAAIEGRKLVVWKRGKVVK